MKIRPRTKCCPFCGCEQSTIVYDSIIEKHAYLRCDQCRAQGPSVFASELMDGYLAASLEEDINDALDEIATTRWNFRPPMANWYPDEIREVERHATADV